METIELQSGGKVPDKFTGIIKVPSMTGSPGLGTVKIYTVGYYKNGFLHREDGPALTKTIGNAMYYLDGYYMGDMKAYWSEVYRRNQGTGNDTETLALSNLLAMEVK